MSAVTARTLIGSRAPAVRIPLDTLAPSRPRKALTEDS